MRIQKSRESIRRRGFGAPVELRDANPVFAFSEQRRQIKPNCKDASTAFRSRADSSINGVCHLGRQLSFEIGLLAQ